MAKLRNDYVTNSSSSSFVITLKDGKTFADFKEVITKIIEANNELTGQELSFGGIFEDWVTDDTSEFTLYSSCENSIPYWLTVYLQWTLDAERTHRG